MMILIECEGNCEKPIAMEFDHLPNSDEFNQAINDEGWESNFETGMCASCAAKKLIANNTEYDGKIEWTHK